MPRTSRFTVSLAVARAVAIAVTATGCSSLYTAPTTVVPTNSQFNTAVVVPAGSTLSTFNLSATTTVGVTLVSVVSKATGQVLSPTMQLLLGRPTNATTCAPVSVKVVTPALAAQIQVSLSAGTYCIDVQDFTLAEPGIVSVRINTSTTAPTNIPTPASTDIFSSTVGVQGSATHQLAVFFSGTATLTLVSAGASIGIGFGAWDGQTCRFFSLQTATPSANALVSTMVDPGNYCIRVSDLGQLSAPILFTVDTLHP